ncbi:hypothetical protein EB73_04375 [Mycobacterium sp. SWH-M3]|nr:hypothetical protein EB73_04375 [Mycobacterium sp. SWH-M3]
MRTGDEIYYELPARDVQAGASTDDGQDITAVEALPDGMIYIEVYTPGGDAERDGVQRGAPETRLYKPDDQVQLAVFADTDIDLSGHERATNRRSWASRTP